jgi:hypothetical protein
VSEAQHGLEDQAAVAEALRHFHEVVEAYRRAYRTRPLPKGAPTPERIQESWQRLADGLRCLTAEDYQAARAKQGRRRE